MCVSQGTEKEKPNNSNSIDVGKILKATPSGKGYFLSFSGGLATGIVLTTAIVYILNKNKQVTPQNSVSSTFAELNL